MRRQLTCEAVLKFPVPNIHQLTAQLQSMYDGAKPPVSARLAERTLDDR